MPHPLFALFGKMPAFFPALANAMISIAVVQSGNFQIIGGALFSLTPQRLSKKDLSPRSATTIAPFNPRTPRRSRCSPAVTSPSRRAPRTRTTSLPSKMSRCRPCRPPVRGPMPACCNLISVRRADQRVAVRISGERSCPFATHNVRLLRETQGALLTRPPLSPQYVFVAL